ncbi:MAG: protein kinase [Anaerolineae bacterium]|nr:protein kinase [Anaerolineae bacterium]
MTFTIGETVGPYRIVSQLGQGGMATVYKAFHAALNRYVAMKVLHPSFQEDETFYSRFKREAQIVAQLEHPNIVPVYDFSEHNSNPYLVMKFIEGDTLKHRIRRQKLTLEETLKYMTAVAEALTYAHERDILHRDVKPSNVMIDNTNFPYLADFGLARIASTGESTMSQDVLIGTPHYISPEQAKGVKSLGPATDIYSMGIMLYEIVVGRVPFSADTPYAIVHDHIYKPLPMPRLVNPTVPPAVEAVLLKSLSKQPEDRYPTAVALMDAFKQAVADSQLGELSAASVQMDKFEEASLAAAALESQKTPTPPPTGIDDQLMAHVRAAITEALATETSHRPEAAIPAPYVSTPIPYSAPRRRRGSQRGFWLLIGTAALVFICIASLAVSIRALNDPVVSRGAAPPEEETPGASDHLPPVSQGTFTIDDFNESDMAKLTVEQAMKLTETFPERPEAQMLLSFAYLNQGQPEAAQETLVHVLSEMNPSADLIAMAARSTASQGFNSEATMLWLAAYMLEPANQERRNESGQYIYRQLNNASLEEFTAFSQMAEPYMDTAFAKSMMAQARISNIPDSMITLTPGMKKNIEILLEESLELDDRLAETYLIYGNYYELIGDTDEAQNSWRYAISFEDTPEWVLREVNLKLEEQ